MSGHRSVEGEVRAIARGGDAVVDTPRGIVLVPGALPGERIELEPTPSKRGAGRGRLKRIVRQSDLRRDAPCPVASRCGGCPLMIAGASLQRDIKLGFLSDACRDLPGAEDTIAEWVESPEDLGYRRRARLAWHHGTMGYRSFRSTRVTDVADCMILKEPLQMAWSTARRYLASSLQGEGELQLELTGTDRVVVSLQSVGHQPPAAYEACEELAKHPVIAAVSLRTADAEHAARWGNPEIVFEGHAGSLRGPAGGFFQANDGVNVELVRKVLELAEPDGKRVLELHSGIGNFTLGLAARAAALVAVERDPRAVRACQANLRRLGLRARVIVGDANRPPKGPFDVVVLDPPRQGAKTLFEEGGLLPGPKRVIYVSCDTATLARDLRLATSKGYRIDKVIAFDMFPHTAHLESAVRLVRS
ncbi:MAG: methyltransferase domain-containing protein [Polyangiales bacterium]